MTEGLCFAQACSQVRPFQFSFTRPLAKLFSHPSLYSRSQADLCQPPFTYARFSTSQSNRWKCINIPRLGLSGTLAKRANQKRHPCTARRRWAPCARGCAPAGGQQEKRQECQGVSTKTPHPVRTREDRARHSIFPLNHQRQVGFWPVSDTWFIENERRCLREATLDPLTNGSLVHEPESPP